MLRVGAIRYINFLPLFAAVELGKVHSTSQYRFDVPAALNSALRSGELDISPISAAEYLANAPSYELLPHYCIGAVDRVFSVTLYTRYPVEQLDGRTIGLTAQSASSVLLLKVLCYHFWKVSPHFQVFDDLKNHSQFDALLVIGDDALLHPELPGYQNIDLATAWHDSTALPFTFAVFAARKSTQLGQRQAFNERLELSYQWAQENPDVILSLARQRLPISIERLKAYYEALRYPFCPQQQAGLNRFHDLVRTLKE